MSRTALALCLTLVACKDPVRPPMPPPSSAPAVEPVDEAEPDESAGGPRNSPVTLTASDGTGLEIVSFEARAVVQDPLAFTELHITFRNPAPRVLEGQFEITLPPSATVSRFAMKQAFGWQEGEVVELQAARAAYEDFLHRRQDPALLEKQPGNQFHARVFPIAPSGDKEIILSYSEALTRAGEPYRLHLRGLPLLQALRVRAIVGRRSAGTTGPMGAARMSYESVELTKERIQPDVDFVVPLPAVSQQPQAGLRSQELAVARITPVATAMPDTLQGGLYVLFDTSASRAPGYARQVDRLGALVAEIGKAAGDKTRLKVVAFDQSTAPIYEGTLGGFDDKARGRLVERAPLGASDLAAALAQAATTARGYARVLVVTDGIVTAGATDGKVIAEGVRRLAGSGVERLDALVSGGIRDADRLTQLTTAGLPRDGVVLDGDRAPSALVRRLLRGTVSRLKVSVPGAAWVWPERIDGIQPGDQVLVYADLPAKETMVVNLDGPAAAGNDTHFSYPVQLTEVDRPLLERAAVNAHIHRLEAEKSAASPERAAVLHKEIVELSTRFRVLCDETALLVLETEADYARFGIDRRALSDILTVGQSGLEIVSRRGSPPPLAQPSTPQDPTRTGDWAGAREKDEGGPRGGAEPEAKKPTISAPPAAALEENKMGKRDARGPTGRDALRAQVQGGAPSPSAVLAEPPGAAPTPAPARRRPSPVDHLDDAFGGAAPMPPGEAARPAKVDPYTGKLKEVMDLVGKKRLDEALARAWRWRGEDPGDVLALVALGEAYEHKGAREAAARAYGSLVDLFPGRADLRRFAGERLERLGDAGLSLAIDTYQKAREQRPDHPASHRLLAYALVRAGDLAQAFGVLKGASERSYPDGRFRGVDRILREDLAIVAAAWLAKAGKDRAQVEAQLKAAGITPASERSVRFVLNWETDANDVDFHITDGKQGHAYFSTPRLLSGGELYADVTTGYGPECFTIPGAPTAYPYHLEAHYYSRGPMGYGMGKLEIMEHDGKGGLRFEERPFVIMVDGAYVDLGKVTGPLPAAR